MNIPHNITLPLFAYGIFKPGQLCFHRIKDLVEKSIEGTVNGCLFEKDGIPLLITSSNNNQIKGNLLYFQNGKEEDAYKRIMEIEPEDIYQWKEVKVNVEVNANTLHGRKGGRGGGEIESNEWDGKSDPFFGVGLEEIEKILRDNQNFDWELRSLFRLQMAYAFLWSAIERYAGLKYHLGKKAMEKVKQISNEKSFSDSLKRNVKDRRVVISATDYNKYSLDPNDPTASLNYYYQVRSNAIHRGKAVTKDFEIIKSSLTELLAVFKDILKEAFQE